MDEMTRDELLAILIEGIQTRQFYAKHVNGEVRYIAVEHGGTEDGLSLEEVARLDHWPSYWRELPEWYS